MIRIGAPRVPATPSIRSARPILQTSLRYRQHDAFRTYLPRSSPQGSRQLTQSKRIRPLSAAHASLASRLLRPISTKPLPTHHGPVFRFFYRFLAYTGGFILVAGGLVLGFFIYDATTYREDLSYTDIPVSTEALHPRRGGPKNLPIADTLVSDDDCPENARAKHKPKLVILGSGWGSVALLKQLKPEDYHITVVSPVNYFLFTPMLPSATVGTLELRSLVEPIRRIVQRVKGHFLRAEAVDVELSERLLEVKQTDATGEQRHFYLPYDKLVISVGEILLCPESPTTVNLIKAQPPMPTA